MDWPSILFLSLALSADAAAVAAARGLGLARVMPRHLAAVALWFGGAQAGMALAGALLGVRFGGLIEAYDHWVAFGVLSVLGLKLLHEARSAPEAGSDADAPDPFAARTMAMLAIATSIDALAVGVTLPLLGAPLRLTLASIGLVTAATSALGLVAGRRFGALLGRRIDAAGGLVLIALGIKILVEHLR